MICTNFILQNFIKKIIETDSICPSSTSLLRFKLLIVPLEFVDSIRFVQCQSTISDVITPINRMIKEWKNGGMCPQCAFNYKQQDFDTCEIVFDKLIEGVYKENQVLKKLQTSGNAFLQSIEQFEKEYDCADAKLPYLPQ